MAARVSTIWFVDSDDARAELSAYPQPDQHAALAVARLLHPDKEFESLGPHPLSIAATVQPGYLFIGTYKNISVVCSAELNTHLPSELPDSWLQATCADRTLLVSSAPDRAQGSFALWEGTELRRSFSAIPVDIVENIGIPLSWELPYWAGEHPLRYPPGILPDPQSLPFHPQQFAEAANAEWLGFHYTGTSGEGDLDKTQILLWGFKIQQAKPAEPTEAEPAEPTEAEPAEPTEAEPAEPTEAERSSDEHTPDSPPIPGPATEERVPEEPADPVEDLDPPSPEPLLPEPLLPEPLLEEPLPEEAPLPEFPIQAPRLESTEQPDTPVEPEPKKRGFLARYFGIR